MEDERVFSLKITKKDFLIISLCAVMSIIGIGEFITHDLAFGLLIAIISMVFYITTRCSYFNPKKYSESRQIEYRESRLESKNSGSFMNFITSILMLEIGATILNKTDIWFVYSNGNESPIITFSDMEHSATCGWIFISLSLLFAYLALKPIFVVLKNKLFGD